ncbi:hypothetical protein C8R47DRAFT_1141820 [Mycena vitilis]|nr:hypothetical protein C8R47DRAFT_1141820 [Mycena vitilis]
MQRVDFTSMDVTVKRGGKTQASTPISLPPVIVPVIPAPGIPVYAQARWVTDYLHSVYCRLGALKGNPWELPGGDAQFIQEVWNRVYHASGYLITLGCPVFIKTKDRINDKRSYFGKRPQSNVDALFAGPDFIGNPKKIAKYAKWALRDDGPGIWGTPSPQGLKRGDTGYTEPDGIFISVHIIKVLAPFIKSTAETVYNYGYPSAAVALTCAGLERGWLRWITGYKVEDGTPFSREQVSGLVADYAQSVAGLSPRRWGLILDACRGHSLAEAPVAVSASTMETNRHQLFIGSSPVKDSDDSF